LGTLVPCEQKRSRVVTDEYPYSAVNKIERQTEGLVEDGAALSHPEKWHLLQAALWFQHEAAGLEVIADYELFLSPPDAGIFRAATRSRRLRRKHGRAGDESQQA
jgi:hypothetical protein